MKWYEILIIVIAVCIVLTVFGVRLYKHINNKPLDECASCGNKGKNLVKYYHKQKRKQAKRCCCD